MTCERRSFDSCAFDGSDVDDDSGTRRCDWAPRKAMMRTTTTTTTLQLPGAC